MIHDPFYRDIISRLNEKIDPWLFEDCAADLLRSTYPALVPIRGGSDSGMDGAIGDIKGVPFPLITTTGKNVIGNLKKNLTSYRDHGGHRKSCVLATSQELTPKRRKNLFDRSRELDFTLLQVHEQADFANRLHRDPKWCLELLNLSGAPPALSVFPCTERPLLDLPLIGREADLAWIRDSDEDRMLVGQPGDGKTFLLHKLAMEGKGLFIVNDNSRLYE